jgi:hypothetical protein
LFSEISVLSSKIIAYASQLEYDVDYNGEQRSLLVILWTISLSNKARSQAWDAGFFMINGGVFFNVE